MWKFSIICSFMAIFTGIALNLVSNSIQDKTKYLAQLENQINKGFEVIVAEDDNSQETKKIIRQRHLSS